MAPAQKKKNFTVLMASAALLGWMIAAPAFAQSTSGNNVPANSPSSVNAMLNPQAQNVMQNAYNDAVKQAEQAGAAAARRRMANTSVTGTMPAGAAVPAPAEMTQAELDKLLKDKDTPQYKANKLAEEAKKDLHLFGRPRKGEFLQNVTNDAVTPSELEALQRVHESNGSSYDISDELLSKELSLDMRRDSQREAALSYGARGGLAKKAYILMEKVQDYEGVLDKVFDFRQLLVKAPSGMLIEPPIVNEALDALVIEQGGSEAAVADQVLKINKQAKIVSAPRDWRQYLVFSAYAVEIPPPPRVLWPKNKKEQADWNTWVRQGWEAGFAQGDDIFESNLASLVSDYKGMVRYRALLAEGKISQPFAMQEDRGVTGGKDEMRVGDRALRITGPSQFLTGGNLWKPADR